MMKLKAFEQRASELREILSSFCDEISDSGPSHEIPLLRRAYELIIEIDPDRTSIASTLLDYNQFEKFLINKAVESAAFSLLPIDSGYMLSRGELNISLASVVLSSLQEGSPFEGETTALALTGAYFSALADLTSGNSDSP